MALQKEIMTGYGIPVNYHKVAVTAVNWYSKKARIEVMSFTNKESAENGLAPLVISPYDFENDDFSFVPEENILKQAYEKLKTTDAFKEAADIYLIK